MPMFNTRPSDDDRYIDEWLAWGWSELLAYMVKITRYEEWYRRHRGPDPWR